MASILYLSNSRLPSTSANAVQTASMATAFAEIGHAPNLICHAGPGTDDEVRRAYALSEAVALHRIPQRGPKGTHTALYLADVRTTARAVGAVDLVFSRDLHAVSSLPRLPVPLIFEAHRAIGGRLERFLFRRLVRSGRLDRLVVVSAGMERAFLEAFDDLDPSLVVVEPGAASVPRSEGPPFELRRRPGAFQVGYVGGLYRGRGVPLMMETARALPEVDFHLVGGSPTEVSTWAESAPTNMAFYGHVESTRLGFIYADLDALLAPYERRVYTAGAAETSSVMSPLKIFEYMACGLANHRVRPPRRSGRSSTMASRRCSYRQMNRIGGPRP